MYAIRMVLDGFFHDDIIFTGNSTDDIYSKIYEFQSLDCLYMMGRDQERSKKGKESMKRLGEFLGKYHSSELTIEDYKLLNLDISLGGIHVTDAVEGDEEIEDLKAKYPEAKQK